MKTITCIIVLMSVVACVSDGDYRKINREGVEKFSIIKSKSAHNLPFKKESYFIPMETAEEYMLGEVEKVLANDSCVFIADNQKVVCYDLNGEMSEGHIRYGIKDIGAGPGEYFKIVDVAINNQFLFVYDDRKINCYDIKNGKYLKTIKLDFAARELSALQDHLIFYTSSFQNHPPNGYELIVVNIHNGSQARYFKHQSKYLGSSEGNQLSRKGNDVFYCSPYRNIVYRFDDFAVPQPFMVLVFDQANTVFDLALEETIHTPQDLKDGNRNCYFNNLLKTGDFWSIQFTFMGHQQAAWCNSQKSDSTYIVGATIGKQTEFKDCIIMPVDSWQVARFNPELFKENKEALKMYSKVLNVDEHDNPCLLVKKIRVR